MSSMLWKDFLREIKHTKSRFLSILILVALSVAFFSGLRSTAPDMKTTGDNYLDSLHLADMTVMSNLGLTQEDVALLQAREEIEKAEGAYVIDAYAAAGDRELVAKIYSLTQQDINNVTLLSGRMPERANECVVEEEMLRQLAISLGDTISLTPGEELEDALINQRFTVVGAIRSPLYISVERGTSTLGTGEVQGYCYLLPDAFSMEAYTTVYLRAAGAGEMTAFYDDYDDYIDSILDALEPLGEERAKVRYDELVGDANDTLAEAEAELADAKAEVTQELADAEAELADAREELDDGWADYYSGLSELSDAKAEGETELSDAEAELADARVELEEGETDYEAGLAEYEDGLASYEEGKQAYEDGMAEILEAEEELKETANSLSAAGSQLDAAKTQLENSEKQLDALVKPIAEKLGMSTAKFIDALANENPIAVAALDAAKAPLQGQLDQVNTYLKLDPTNAELLAQQAQLEAAIDALNKQALIDAQHQIDDGWRQYESGTAALRDGWQQYQDGYAEVTKGKEELAAALSELSDAWVQLEDARVELEDARAQLDDGWIEYEDGLAELADARETFAAEIADAERELSQGRSDLLKGEAEYNDGLIDYEKGVREADEELADAEEEIADARREIAKIERGEWYLLSRSYNPGYTGFGQDADRMGALASVFPLIFFLVAALVCLTTMTRMVEEQRVQIGALKALGYSRLAISVKYVGYGLLPSLVGGVLGLVIGYTLFPTMIFTAYQIMYYVPSIELHAYWDISLYSLLAAVACTTVSTLWACLATLRSTPAILMRPKTPKAGKRIFLEYIRPLWRGLRFTYKVTARNLFRYQKRFWMTVIGIGGCTALIIAGFGLRSSLLVTMSRQYEDLFHYTAQISLADSALEEDRAEVERFVASDERVTRFTPARVIPATATTDAYSITTYGQVLDPQALPDFITLLDYATGETLTMGDEGVYIDQKLSELLEVGVGDTVFLDGDDGMQVTVAGIFEHYTGHFAYMTPAYYESVTGKAAETNAYLLTLTDETSVDDFFEDVMALDGIAAATNNADTKTTYQSSMERVDFVVVIVILAAAALAMVVLFNLSNINITERQRELATIKLLGFYDREVTAYIYRENAVLTVLGILLGIVLGHYMHVYLIHSVEIDLMMFGRDTDPMSYLYAAILTVLFSLVVNIMAHFKLKRINMVESLKSAE